MPVDSPIKVFNEFWIGAWTLLLAAGLVADMTPWPALRAFRAKHVYSSMLLTSAAVVLFLTLVGLSRPAAEITIWAVLACLIKHLVDEYNPEM